MVWAISAVEVFSAGVKKYGSAEPSYAEAFATMARMAADMKDKMAKVHYLASGTSTLDDPYSPTHSYSAQYRPTGAVERQKQSREGSEQKVNEVELTEH